MPIPKKIKKNHTNDKFCIYQQPNDKHKIILTIISTKKKEKKIKFLVNPL